jgi:hypothetical protein
MLNIQFLHYRSAIIRYDHIAHARDQHFVHALWTKGGANRLSDDFRRQNVVSLCIATSSSARALFQN